MATHRRPHLAPSKIMATQFTSEGLQLSDGSSVAVYSGEFHYWRGERKTWRPALQALKKLGLTMVSTPVPWSVHETSVGQYDFANSLDLGAFLDEVHDLGLYALLRPGPNCGAQLTQFGFPQRLLADPEIQATSGRGTALWLPAPPKMFPVPSYASSKFQTEVRAWYARLAEVILPRANPGGAVVALQVDHEMQMFGRIAAFEGDYHPDALAWWNDYAGGQEAPKSYSEDDMPRVLRWQSFKEEYLRRSLCWLGEALDEAGMGSLARYHNLAPSDPSSCNLPMLESAIKGIAGMDFYDLGRGYSRVRKRATYLAGTSMLPFAPQLSVGGPPWLPTVTEEDEKNMALGALAGGIRAFNVYMAVERERWYGGLLDDRARSTASADWIAPLLETLNEVSWPSLRRETPIAVVVSRAEARAAVASQAVHSASHALTEWLGLGPEGHAALALDADARLYPRWFAAIIAALDLAELPYQLVDERSLHTIVANTKALVLPTLRRVDGAAWAALHALATTGIQVIIGPEVPREDELGQPLGADAVSPKGAGMIASKMLDEPDELAASLLDLAGDLGDLWIAPENLSVDCSLYSDSSGKARALFVGNRESMATEARVNVPESCVLRDGITGEEVAEEQGMALISLGSYQVRLFALS